MTLKEAIGVHNANVDIKTGETLTHSEIYGRAIDLLGGLDVVAKYVPYPLDVLTREYRHDKAFNRTSIRRWDAAAGFKTHNGQCDLIGGGIWYLYRKHGINSASCCDGVCILKEAARRLVLQAKAKA